MSADPFLRFLTDVFCGGVQPKVREAVFLAAWTVQHAIDTTPGGVAGPIRVVTFEPDGAAGYVGRELPEADIDEHLQAIESAANALREWRDRIQTGAAAGDAPAPPSAPDA
jgi:hypothetical protein